MFRPLLRARPMALLVVVVAFGLTACVKPAPRVAGPAPAPAPAPAPSQASGLAGDIFARHNTARAQNGVAALSYDANAASHAQFHAARTQSTPACNSHSGELGTWYPGMFAAENILCLTSCAVDPAQVMSVWLGSGPHRANILNGNYHAMGVGISCNAGKAMVVVQFHS